MSTSIVHQFQQLRSLLSQLSRHSVVGEYQRDQRNAFKPNNQALGLRLVDVVSRTWHLGVTAFGGPPVHFSIFHQAFTEKNGKYAPWIDEQTYQDVFALCQSLPGPGSTKMLFITIFMHAGIVCAVVGFLIWSLPGAVAMYLLSLGISNVGEHLPLPVYALLSGLNAASVGVIALAGVGLASKASKDNLTRMLVIGSGCAGLCYTALWFFPVLIVIGGLVAWSWDLYVSRWIGKLRAKLQRRGQPREPIDAVEVAAHDIPLANITPRSDQTQKRMASQSATMPSSSHVATDSSPTVLNGPEFMGQDSTTEANSSDIHMHAISVRAGATITAFFLAAFIVIMTTRSLVQSKTLAYSLFSNMFLAGVIIFGGGPVVIPLLREYVVEPGWVSARDFLIGIAVIQALPGPNFNFAVYLGALALRGGSASGVLGAILGFVGIFTPGLVLALGLQSVWDRMRTKAWVMSVLRGVNSVAVGFVFTAVYRLWEIGYVTADSTNGRPLADDPWWVVVAVLAYSGSCWFKVPPSVSILGGGVLGLCWYAVTRSR